MGKRKRKKKSKAFDVPYLGDGGFMPYKAKYSPDKKGKMVTVGTSLKAVRAYRKKKAKKKK